MIQPPCTDSTDKIRLFHSSHNGIHEKVGLRKIGAQYSGMFIKNRFCRFCIERFTFGPQQESGIDPEFVKVIRQTWVWLRQASFGRETNYSPRMIGRLI